METTPSASEKPDIGISKHGVIIGVSYVNNINIIKVSLVFHVSTSPRMRPYNMRNHPETYSSLDTPL